MIEHFLWSPSCWSVLHPPGPYIATGEFPVELRVCNEKFGLSLYIKLFFYLITQVHQFPPILGKVGRRGYV